MSGLPVVTLHGLQADSLGAYLGSLGLLSLTTREWPSVRACWRNSCFCLVGGPSKLEDVVEYVSKVGERNGWTDYQMPWDQKKKADVKAKTSTQTAVWRAHEADEGLLLLFGAHLALDGRVRMNPLLGSGGNAGNRNFAKGWKVAVKVISVPPKKWSRETMNRDLEAFLSSGACTCLGSFNAASWFGAANRIFNHGTSKPFREGEVTPWAMALACEGLTYFAGGPSRRLGSRTQPKGAFSFVTTAMPPRVEKEAGVVEAEIWAPIWVQPMTDPELRALFSHGRAELQGRGATSTAGFSVAILGRGVDAGVTEFRRFTLLHTTSKQSFESRLATVVPVPKTAEDSATTRALRMIVSFRETLPPDKKVRKRWRFAGLRGPLDQTLVDFSAAELGAARVERAWVLVDQMFDALTKVDRNGTFRGHNVRFELLPGEWVAQLFQDAPPDREQRLALALSSLRGTPKIPQFVAYRIGVHRSKTVWQFPERAPARRVWTDAGLADNLCAVAERRVMEASRQAKSPPPFDSAVLATLSDVQAWLSGEAEEERVQLWLDRFCLFDWNGEANREAAKRLQGDFSNERLVVDGAAALYGLFRPLVSDWLFRKVLDESGIRSRASTIAHLGRVFAMLQAGDLTSAVEMAYAAYRSTGVALADCDALHRGPDAHRLLAALVVPTRDQQTLRLFQRWRTPTKPNEP